MKKINVAVLASGGGTNFQSIIDNWERGGLEEINLKLLICNKPDAYCIERAKKHKIDFRVIDHREKTREEFEKEMVRALEEYKIDLIVLAGFMRMLSPYFVNRYKWKILNIHPALLPAFPGTDGQGDALKYGVKVSGCTTHFVDEGEDTGPIILQKAVPVMDDDTRDTLAHRILEWEHRIYPLTIKLFAQGRLKIDGRHVRIKNYEEVLKKLNEK